MRTSKVSGPPDARGARKDQRSRRVLGGRATITEAAAQPLQARGSLALERCTAVRAGLSIDRPSPHLPPPLSRRYRRRRSCRGARSAGAHTAVRLDRANRHSRPPRGRSTSGMRQSSRRRHARGCRRERAPLLRHARERSASACMASVRWRARRCARMGDAYTRVVCTLVETWAEACGRQRTIRIASHAPKLHRCTADGWGACTFRL